MFLGAELLLSHPATLEARLLFLETPMAGPLQKPDATYSVLRQGFP